MRATGEGMAGGDLRVNGSLHSITIRDTGCPTAGHLQTGHGDWAIPQVYCVCAVNVPVGGAHEEMLEQYCPTYSLDSLFFWITIHSAENSDVFEDSCPRGSLGITSVILCVEISCRLPSRL